MESIINNSNVQQIVLDYHRVKSIKKGNQLVYTSDPMPLQNYILLSTNGIVNYSMDGIHFLATRIPGNITTWVGCVYGLGNYVAFSQSGKMAVSTNGIDWGIGTFDNNVSPAFLTLLFHNEYFISFTSSDLWTATSIESWNKRELKISGEAPRPACGNGIVIFGPVGAGKRNYNRFNTTTNSITSVAWGGSNPNHSYCFGNNKFVSFRANSNTLSISEDDALTWNNYTFADNPDLLPTITGYAPTSVAFGDGKFIGTAYNDEVLVSEDGLHWSLNALPELDSAGYGRSIHYKGNKWYLINSKYNNKLFYSETGISYSPINLPQGLSGGTGWVGFATCL